MARLNEAAASVETLDVEALNSQLQDQTKRNEDISRACSNQSTRIETLKGDVERLSSENIALRKRVISLQYEVNKRPGHSVWDNMGIVRGKLNAKLAEVRGLMQELGKIQIAAENHRLPKKKSMCRTSSQRSPDQRNWKNTLTLAEAVGGGKRRLSPIVEEKYFPRKTLDAEELFEIFPDPANLTDSPDLGPPPVAHFEEGDPVKFDPSRGSASISTEDVRPRSVAFANLETRKRRRESSSITHAKTHGVTDAQPLLPGASTDEASSLVQPLRSGAKRKLNAREEEAVSETEKASQDDGFMFNRRHMLADLNKSVSVSVKSDALKADSSPIQKTSLDHSDKATQGKASEPTIVVENSRKALGPKSVNKDPKSPMKLGKLAENEKIAGIKEDMVKDFPSRDRLKDRRPSKTVSIPKELDHVNIMGLNTKKEPETSAPPSHDPFSPLLSQARPGSRDTPTPSDLNSEKSTLEAAGRGSRRSRGSVSYAEPNLRVKMRRPTKGLVDAVSTGERPLYLASVNVEETNLEVEPTSEKNIPRTVVLTEEDDGVAISSWKTFSSTDPPDHHHGNREEPTSPLGNRISAPSAELPTSVITDRRRRTMGLHRTDGEGAEQAKHHPGAGSAIAALVAGTQKARRRQDESRPKETPAETSEIYDLRTSSPTHGLADSDGKRTPHTAAPPTRTSRRHSSIPVDDNAPAASDAQPGASSLEPRGPQTGTKERKARGR